MFESEFNKILIYTREEQRGEETEMYDLVLTHTEIEDKSFSNATLWECLI